MTTYRFAREHTCILACRKTHKLRNFPHNSRNVAPGCATKWSRKWERQCGNDGKTIEQHQHKHWHKIWFQQKEDLPLTLRQGWIKWNIAKERKKKKNWQNRSRRGLARLLFDAICALTSQNGSAEASCSGPNNARLCYVNASVNETRRPLLRARQTLSCCSRSFSSSISRLTRSCSSCSRRFSWQTRKKKRRMRRRKRKAWIEYNRIDVLYWSQNGKLCFCSTKNNAKKKPCTGITKIFKSIYMKQTNTSRYAKDKWIVHEAASER